MKPGSVIVDLRLPPPVATVEDIPNRPGCSSPRTASGDRLAPICRVVCPPNPPSSTGTNLVNLMKLMCKEKDGNVAIDFEDVVQRNMTLIQAGEVTFLPLPSSRLCRAMKPAASRCA